MPDDPATGLLSVDALNVSIGGTPLLSDVSFTVGEGEVVGLVGESGSGKTLTGLSVMGLLPTMATVRGSIRFDGAEMTNAGPEELRRRRGSEISMIFQEPRASLHPARPIGKQLVDVIRAHEDVRKAVARERACELLTQVGLPSPRRTLAACTHELSGGMCQRIMIAMALICRPRLLIADEPTTALDVTIQAQIVTVLRRMAADLGLSVLLISHNLGVVSELCSRIITMYCGQVVNIDGTDALLRHPRHPYPQALVQASDVDIERDRRAAIGGTPADPAAPPHGCRFHPRCPYRTEACETAVPPLETTASGALTRCVRHGELTLTGVAE